MRGYHPLKKHVIVIHEGVPPTPLPTPIHVFTPIPRSSIDSGKMRPSPWVAFVASMYHYIIYMYVIHVTISISYTYLIINIYYRKKFFKSLDKSEIVPIFVPSLNI